MGADGEKRGGAFRVWAPFGRRFHRKALRIIDILGYNNAQQSAF